MWKGNGRGEGRRVVGINWENGWRVVAEGRMVGE